MVVCSWPSEPVVPPDVDVVLSAGFKGEGDSRRLLSKGWVDKWGAVE